MREDLDLENLDDPRLITLDEMISNNSFFPPIPQNTFGKATGALVKSLLNNFSVDKQKHHDNGDRYQSKRANNNPPS